MSKSINSVLVFTQMFPQSKDDAVISGMIKNPYYQTLSLKRAGCSVDVITTGSNKCFYEYDGLKVYSVGDGFLKGIVKSFTYELKMFIKYIMLTRKNNYDVIHVHHLNIPWLGLLKKLGFLKSHLVYTAHGTSTPELNAARQGSQVFYFLLKINGKLQHVLDRWCWKQADLLLSPSLFQIKEMHELYGVKNKPIEVVYNGYDERLYYENKKLGRSVRKKLGINDEDEVIVFVGRVARKKGIDHLIKAMDDILISLPNAKLIVVMGFIGRQKDFKDQIYDMVSGNRSIYLYENIPEPELAGYYNAANLCVFPSLGYESIPTVIYEAAACGVPILTQGAWGIPEVLTGDFLDESEIQNESLSKRIVALLTNAELLASYSSENLKTSDKFSWGNGGEKLLNIFNKYFVK
ncbi:glycosyltransferase family 4 protein [Neptuniibacter sp. 2_MG-2023]|uniref:glycosyltransferase family 4 protein n=1 Tax=Neptuniibacter sp. 2_MG-2023 TaxID=3062671 RepID=UPI0026E40523|nr:glycosyltransferase family 4 protein [Neptuniibacter sp. 2_MG-2023]MDO6515539.1 glycosyltransferase family 4 protein [Neptuniibacter sp. 2_MG-2023]